MQLLALLLAAPELLFSAGRLEVDADRWSAQAIELQLDGATLSAAAAEGQPSTDCPSLDLQLHGPLAVVRGADRATAASGQLCLPGGAVAVQSVEVASAGGQVGAEQASLDGSSIHATQAWASRCACKDPPWRVTASTVDGRLDQGLWATWPVLWAGGVPIAAAPAWYVPLGERRSGVLAPRLGYDGDQGPWGHLPVYWAPHKSFDLTLAPGYRHGLGAAGAGQLRWATSREDRGQVDAEYILDEGHVVAPRGSANWGPVRLALDGEATDALGVRAAVHPQLTARRRDHLALRGGLSVVGRHAGVGARAAHLHDLVALERETVTEEWLRWNQQLGPAGLQLGAVHSQFYEASTHIIDLSAQGQIDEWLGPLRLHPSGGVATTVFAEDEAPEGAPEDASDTLTSTAPVGWLTGAATIGLARAFESFRHEALLTLRGHFARAEQMPARARFGLDPHTRPLERTGADATVSNKLIAANWAAQLDITAGYESEAPVEGRAPVLIEATVDAPAFTLSATASEADFAALDARVGDPSGWYFGADINRFQAEAATAQLRPRGRPYQLLAAIPEGTTGGARLGATLAGLHLAYGLHADLEDPKVQGQRATLAYTGRCDCWTLRADATHTRNADAPDVWLSLSL